MSISNNPQPEIGGKAPDNTQAASSVNEPEIQVVTTDTAAVTADFPDDIYLQKVTPNQDAQRGVQKIEAVTIAWSRKSLAALLIKYICPRSVCPADK